uniref:Cytochrome P450 4c21 n=1 Tax=Lygus hesperus TaxID=30085 RepID=A0A0A9XUP5_LYGHE
MLDSVKHLAVDMLLESVYGVPGNQFRSNAMDFPVVSARAIELVFLQMMKVEYRVSWLFNILAGGRESKLVKQKLHVMTEYIVNCRYEEFEKTGIYPGDPHFVPANYTDAILQYAKTQNWSNDDLDVLLDVLVAGADTPAMLISAMCLYLAMYPEYQEKAYQEQMEVMGDSLEAPNMGDLAKMTYLNMILSETLRIAGPPAYLRVLSSEIQTGGYTFPEGSCVLFVLRDLSKNPKYWERPDEFYPDHFLPELVEKRPKGVFLPFSTGARSCAGKNYAEMSCRIGFSMLLRQFKFTTHLKYNELTYKYMLLTESAKGYPVEAIRRSIKT